MAIFTYKATNKEGEEYEGSATVADRFELYSHIQKEGGTIISYAEASVGSGFTLDKLISKIFGRVKETDKIVLTRNLSAMLTAGLSLTRAMAVMTRQTKNAKLKGILAGVESSIEKGGTFHEALIPFPNVFSPLMVAMVKAGEEGGRLAEALSTISNQLDRSYNLKKKIRGALIYPSIVIFALVVVGILMLIFIVPTLTKTFTELNVELPASTKFVIAASNFLTHNTATAIALALLIGGGIWMAQRTRQGRRGFEWALLRVPIVGTLVRETNAARTARTLSSLLSSGVEIVRSLEITEEVVQNSYYKEVIKEAGERIQKGLPLFEVFNKYEGLYPPLVAELIAVGEETGKLPDMLLQIADFYEREVEQKTKDMSTIIEPFLMIIVGSVVGFFAVSMITPIYSITENI